MPPRNILYIQPVGEKGGMEVNLINEIRHSDRTRFTPIVACLQDGPLLGELVQAGAKVFRFDRKRLRNLPYTLTTILKLAILIRSKRVSLVVCQNAVAHLYGRPASFLTHRPCVLRSGGVGNPPDLPERIAYCIGATHVIANSRFTRQLLIEAGVPSTRVSTVHHGVDLNQYAGEVDRDQIKESFGVPRSAPLITTVGRLQRWKGQHVVVQAAPRVLAKHPDARFLIVGAALFGREQQYPDELDALIKALGLVGKVTLTGFRSDIPAILAASDIVVVPSVHPEPFGLVTIEAMAAGKAVVGTDAGGTAEIVRDGVTGLLVPPGSADALADALVRLLGDRDLRNNIGRRARIEVEEHFRIARAVRECQRVYLQCV